MAGTKLVPCGQCKECRLQYARNWADRCMLEAMFHKSNYFLTLTYDDAHVPISENEDEIVYTLLKKDLQEFHKRLRIDLERRNLPKIRYFCSGEYGDHTFRPHYHGIYFGLELDDLVPYEKSAKSGLNLYTSDYLDKLWTGGRVIVGEVTWKSCAYVARYVVKKQKGFLSSTYDFLGIEPEFCVMSRKPGIARQFYDTHKSMYDYDCVYVPTPEGGLRVKPPRYFDKLFEAENPEEFIRVKDSRMYTGMLSQRGKLYHTDLNFPEYNKIAEIAVEDRTRIFKRDVI